MSRHGVDDVVLLAHWAVKTVAMIGMGYMIGKMSRTVFEEVLDELEYGQGTRREGFA